MTSSDVVAAGIPEAIRPAVQAAIASATGRDATLRGISAVGGGCMSPAARLDTAGGDACFLKWNDGAPASMFEAEAEGLRSLRAAAAPAGVCVPEVLGVSSGGASGPAWLLMEFIAEGRAGDRFASALGTGLARMHTSTPHPRAAVVPAFGWSRDNFIGVLPQANPRSARWPEFWRDHRLAPQLRLARERGFLHGEAGKSLDRLMESVEVALAVVTESPSLLHGDLWGGNVYASSDGRPVLVDPAVYRGHREVDLAMSELFGGFPDGWLQHYHDAAPISVGYEEVRRPLYQLYYLLVHVNLFGAGYVDATVAAAREVLAHV